MDNLESDFLKLISTNEMVKRMLEDEDYLNEVIETDPSGFLALVSLRPDLKEEFGKMKIRKAEKLCLEIEAQTEYDTSPFMEKIGKILTFLTGGGWVKDKNRKQAESTGDKHSSEPIETVTDAEIVEETFGEKPTDEEIGIEDNDTVEVQQESSIEKVKQSMQLTKVRYDFTPCEKNIFLKVVEVCQQFLYDRDTGRSEIHIEDRGLSGKVPVVTFYIKDLLKDNSNNYAWVKEGLDKLNGKKFGLPDENWSFRQSVFFQTVMADKNSGKAGVILSVDFWNAFRKTDHYKIIECNVARSFKSIYAVRIYELLVGNIRDITYDIVNIRQMFCLEEKYPRFKDFKKWVLDVARTEMMLIDACPFYFDYEVITGAKNKAEKVKFIVVNKEEKLAKTKDELEREEFNALVKLSDTVRSAMYECYPKIDLNRVDVLGKLKWAQGHLGVNETTDLIKTLKGKTKKMDTEGKIKVNESAYFLGCLDRYVEDYIKEEREKHILKTPEVPVDTNTYPFRRVNVGKDDELNNIGEDDEYKYYTDRFLNHSSSIMNVTVGEYAEKWGFEKIEGGYWKLKK